MLQSTCQAGRRNRRNRIPYPLALITLLATISLAGCGTSPAIEESNYLTYSHPFTDAAVQAAQKNAEKVCAERKQAAVKTRSVCSLKECTTHYQCVDKAAGKNQG